MDHAKVQEALRIAEELAKQAKTAADLHNAFFGVSGRFAELFPTPPTGSVRQDTGVSRDSPLANGLAPSEQSGVMTAGSGSQQS